MPHHTPQPDQVFAGALGRNKKNATSAADLPLVTSLLKIGSESGALSSSALRLADMYESKLEIGMQRLVTVLEPAIILFVSVFIGFIVLSIVGAIMSVYDLTGA